MDNVIYEFYCMSGETTGKLETNYSWDFYSLEQKHRDKYAKPVFLGKPSHHQTHQHPLHNHYRHRHCRLSLSNIRYNKVTQLQFCETQNSSRKKP